MNVAGMECSSRHVLRTSNGFNIQVKAISRPDSGGRGQLLLVNGAFASMRTSRSVWCMLSRYDLVLYDLPHVGSSKPHNDPDRPITVPDEVTILADIAAHYRPRYLVAMSCGGAAALLALAERQLPVEKIVICSFSDRLGDPMRGLLRSLRTCLVAGRWDMAAALLNDTLGEYLHRALKRSNHAHLSGFLEAEQAHILRHVDQMLRVDRLVLDEVLPRVASATLFIDGALDVYTPVSDATRMAAQIPGGHVSVMANMGHFLGVESRSKRALVSRAIENFIEWNRLR